MVMHLLDGPHRNMLTLRAHLSKIVFTYLLHKQLLDCSTTYTTTPRQPCTLHLIAYVRAHLLACLLTYLPNFILSYMPTCLLTCCRRARTRPPQLHSYTLAYIQTYLHTYLVESLAASRLSHLYGYTCTAGTAQPTPPAACKTRTAWQGHTDIRFTLRETATRSIRWNALAMIVCGEPSPQRLNMDRRWRTQPSASECNTGSLTCLPTHSLT